MFVGFSCIFLLGILICKGITVQRLYKSFGVKGLMVSATVSNFGRCILSDTTRQFIFTNTLYGQHVLAITISHHQASHRKAYEQNT
jgi:hypothetical protein